MSWSRSPIGRLSRSAWGSLWSLPVAMLIATLGTVALLLRLDDAGASAALARWGWPFSFSGTTAQQLATALVDVHVSLVALYFSIALLVLTLAAGTLGVRLVDIWIARRTTRATLGMLLSALAAALTVLMAVDPGASGGAVARLSLVVLTAVTILLLGWLGYALHDLGRTIHIDTVIAHLRRCAEAESIQFSDPVAAPRDVDWGTGHLIAAPRSGFIESVGIEGLTRRARKSDLRIRVTALAGDYRIKGEALGHVVGCSPDDAKRLAEEFSMSGYRTASEGATFEVRLLVEIAARALSPAVNDFYTALACVDALGSAIAAHGGASQSEPWLRNDGGTPRIQVMIAPFADLFDAPLKALRHAAARYPVVAIHLILILRRARGLISDAGARSLIAAHIEAVRAHATQVAEFAPDAAGIEHAMTADLPAIVGA